MKNRTRSTLLTASAAMLLFAISTNAQTTAPNPFGDSAQSTAPAPKKPPAQTATKAGQFTSEAEAKASCAGDTVVWVNTSSKIYHYASSADYGKTKRGAYMCEKNTAAAGFRVAKNEKRK
jgi:hypothetical protein